MLFKKIYIVQAYHEVIDVSSTQYIYQKYFPSIVGVMDYMYIHMGGKWNSWH